MPTYLSMENPKRGILSKPFGDKLVIIYMNICGIDYGSKLAGTTVICSWQVNSNKLSFDYSEKKKDADIFLKKKLLESKPTFVFIDAPLSLPLVYQNCPGYNDYFFRKVDRSLQAMSPLFLGGLTARAMKLKADLPSFTFYETYPAAQAKRLQIKLLGYKTKVTQIEPVVTTISNYYPTFDIPSLNNWHAVDALLAFIGAYRFFKKEHLVVGDATEGLVYI